MAYRNVEIKELDPNICEYSISKNNVFISIEILKNINYNINYNYKTSVTRK